MGQRQDKQVRSWKVIKIIGVTVLLGSSMTSLKSQNDFPPLELTYEQDLGDERTVPIDSIRKLRVLDKNITQLPDSILRYSNIKTIIFIKCKFLNLNHLLAQLKTFKTLQYIGLNDCDLKRIPESIGELNQLTGLDLSNNLLSELPKSIGQLNYLTELYLSNNLLTEIPRSMETLKKMELLDVGNNGLTNWSWLIHFKQLTELSIHECNLKVLPNEILTLKKLKRLYIGSNFLKDLPDPMKGLKEIEYLMCDNNLFTEVPRCIKKMSKLQTLYISVKILRNTKLFPKSILNLFIWGNEVQEVPCKCFANLSNVEYIWLHNLGVRSINSCLLDFNPEVQRCYLIFQDCKNLPRDASLGWNKKKSIVVAVGYTRD